MRLDEAYTYHYDNADYQMMDFDGFSPKARGQIGKLTLMIRQEIF